MRFLAIDPGPERSAFVVLSADYLFDREIVPNDVLLRHLRQAGTLNDLIVIEKVESFGMAVGAEVFETVYWSGRFAEASRCERIERIGRKDVKLSLCGSPAARDPNIRQALIDLYGGSTAIGTKSAPGPLYGVAKDIWSALAVAVTYCRKGDATWTPRISPIPMPG